MCGSPVQILRFTNGESETQRSELPKTTQQVSNRARMQMRSQCPRLAGARDHVNRESPDVLTPRTLPGFFLLLNLASLE